MAHIDRGAPERHVLLARGIRLEQLTIGWNLIEAFVAVSAGLWSRSIALVGFGFDSVIEVVAAAALYRRLRGETLRKSVPDAEGRALRVVAATFFMLAAYVGFEATVKLVRRERPEQSLVGIGLTALSLAVMPLLASAKLRVGRALGSRALVADSKETFICAYLSLTVLVGLVANAVLAWWWADPVAALAMLPFILHEGFEALEESRGAEE